MDEGYGWVVVFGSFCCQLIADGCAFSFGILYVELLDAFGESKSTTAWVGSLFIAVPLITGPIASLLTERYGCRRLTFIGGLIAGLGCVLSSQANSIWMLCLSFGILAGFGLSLVYMPAMVIVTLHFDKKLGLATGVAVAGSGIGTFVFAPVTEILAHEYGWRGAMLVIGGIMLNICVCGMLFKEPERCKRSANGKEKMCDGEITDFKVIEITVDEIDESKNDITQSKITSSPITQNESQIPEENEEILVRKSKHKDRCCYSRCRYFTQAANRIDFTALYNLPFIYFCISIFLLYLSYDIPYIFTPDKAIQMGLSEEEASFLVSIIGITSTFGQIIVGIIGDLPWVNTVYLYNIFTMIAGIFTLLVPWYHNYGLLCMFAACYGVFISANYTLVSVILVELLGVGAFTNAYGFEMMAEGFANIIGPPFGGWLTDITGSYDLTFILNGFIMILSGAMLFFMPCLNSRTNQ